MPETSDDMRLDRGDVVLVVSPARGAERSRWMQQPVRLAREAYRALPPFEPGSREQAEASDMVLLAGLVDPRDLPLVQRPLRAPHHTVSTAGMVGSASPMGGGRIDRIGHARARSTEPLPKYKVRPGEVSLAHGGVLLLDDVLDFRGETLEAVARALSLGYSAVRRGYDTTTAGLPARPYAVVMTTSADVLERSSTRSRTAPILGLVTREVRL